MASSQSRYINMSEIKDTVGKGHKFYEIYTPGAKGEKQTKIEYLYNLMYVESPSTGVNKDKYKYINSELAEDDDDESYYRTLDAYYIAFVKKNDIVQQLNQNKLKMQMEPYDSNINQDKRNENVRIVNEDKYLSNLNDQIKPHIDLLKEFLKNYSIMNTEVAEAEKAFDAAVRAEAEAAREEAEAKAAARQARMVAVKSERDKAEELAAEKMNASKVATQAMAEAKRRREAARGAAAKVAVGGTEEAKNAAAAAAAGGTEEAMAAKVVEEAATAATAAVAEETETEEAYFQYTNKLNKFLIIYLFYIFYYNIDGTKHDVPRFNYLLKLPLYHLKFLRDKIIEIAKYDNDSNNTNSLDQILDINNDLEHKQCLVNMVTTIHAYYVYKKLCSNNVYHGSIDKEKLLDITRASKQETRGGTQKYKKNNQINKTRSIISGNYNKTKGKYSSIKPNNNTRKR